MVKQGDKVKILNKGRAYSTFPINQITSNIDYIKQYQYGRGDLCDGMICQVIDILEDEVNRKYILVNCPLSWNPDIEKEIIDELEQREFDGRYYLISEEGIRLAGREK